MKKLSAAQIKSALAAVPEWTRTGATISRTFQFKDFPGAVQFVNAVAEIAERAWHHPDIDIRWNKVVLTLTTHDAGGLTEKDFALARKFDRWPAVKG
jgi:4a-hydroxytetrahydrobiopterin dehydratase